MAYSNFPVTYQPMYSAVQPQYMNTPSPQMQPQPQNNGIIWVQGEAGAKSYLVAPNTTVQLWDSESQTIYLKSADASGMPNMKTLDYTIRENTPPQPAVAQPQADYVTRGEFLAFAEKVEKHFTDPIKTTVKEDNDNG